MTTMLKKVAKAMEERLYQMEQGESPPDCYRRLGMGEYEDLARAALQAIREPSDDVTEAGTVAPKGHIIETHEQRKAVFCVIWNAALDAIENEEKA